MMTVMTMAFVLKFPKAKPCLHNAGGQIINQFYWRVVKNKCCNMIWWNQADQLSGFPTGLYLSVVTVTLPPRPHKSFSGPGKVIPSKLFTNWSGSGCWTWDVRGLFFCSDQIDISGGKKVILEPFRGLRQLEMPPMLRRSRCRRFRCVLRLIALFVTLVHEGSFQERPPCIPGRLSSKHWSFTAKHSRLKLKLLSIAFIFLFSSHCIYHSSCFQKNINNWLLLY